MCKEEIARKMLFEMYEHHGTWELVAQSISQYSDEPISLTAVCKMAKGETRSLRIMKALGLVEKRYRRNTEFEDYNQLQKWDVFLKAHDTTLTKICRGLLDGTIELVFNDKHS